MNYKNKSIFRELYYRPYRSQTTKLYDHSKDNVDFVQRLGLIRTLPLHQGCVNTLCWNEAGTILLSGSDDQHLVVTNGHTYEVMANYRTSHRANIFSAKFLPVSGDHNIVSCSGDGIILYTDLERPSETYYNQFNCHSGTTYEVITIPHDPFTFLSCGEDGTVRWFDLRIKERCKKPRCKEDILISHHRAISALCINPLAAHQLAIGSSDSTVRIFDRRMLGISAETENDKKTHHPVCTFTVPELEDRTYRITSLSYSPDGKDMLVSYSSDHLYLFSTQEPTYIELRKQGESSKQEFSNKRGRRSPPPVRRLRLRGDWSDTGPDARPERDVNQAVSIGQARPQLQATLMERMTNVLFRMLNDPLTRAALSAGGEDSLETNSSQNSQQQAQAATQTEEHTEEQNSEHTETEHERDESMNEEETSDDNDTSSDTSRSTVTSTNEGGTHPETKNEHTQTEGMYVQSSKPSSSTEKNTTSDDNEFTDLRDQLSTLRHGFIEKHGSEPSVSLHYSEQSSTNSTIKIGVGNELDRSSFNLNLPSSSTSGTSQSNNTQISACTCDKKAIEPKSSTPINSETQVNKPRPNEASHSKAKELGDSETTQSQSIPVEPSQSQSVTVESRQIAPSIAQTRQRNPTSEELATIQPVNTLTRRSLVEEVTRNIREPRRTAAENEMDNISISSTGDVYVGQDRQLVDRPTCTDIEIGYSDSDDEPNIINRNIHVNCNARIYQPHVTQKYVGHRNARTMIKEATFWGNDYVMSGSDCGHVFVWDRKTAKLVMLLQADHHVVNCIQPHPTLPILATSGIDHDVKIWAPILEEASFDIKMAEDLMKRNEVMLEETRDTITVPAAFMIRMLACLNQIRRTGSLQRTRRREEPEQDPNAS